MAVLIVQCFHRTLPRLLLTKRVCKFVVSIQHHYLTSVLRFSDETYSILQGNSCEKCNVYAKRWTELVSNSGVSSEKSSSSAHVFNCIADVLSFLDTESMDNSGEIDVLVTGS